MNDDFANRVQLLHELAAVVADLDYRVKAIIAEEGKLVVGATPETVVEAKDRTVTPPTAEELHILAELIGRDRKLKEFPDVGLSRDAAKRRITALCRRYKVGRMGLGYLAGRYGWLDRDPLKARK